MSSEIYQSNKETLDGLKNRLVELEKNYVDFEDAREDNLNLLNTLEGNEVLKEASGLITEYGNAYSEMYGVLEDLIAVYEPMVDMFNIELIDGRLVDDVFMDIEDSFGEVNRLADKHVVCDERMQELVESVQKAYDSLDEVASADLKKAQVTKKIEDGLTSYFDQKFIGGTP